MSTAPILRSSALQKALALTPVPRGPVEGVSGVSFASTLAARLPAATGSAPRPRAITTASSLRPVAPALDTGGPIPFQKEITAAANKYGVDPALLAGLVKQESNFNPSARSGVGAKGLTQLMDATARGLGVSDPFDPAQSLDAGAKFLGGLLKQFHGDQSLA